ncbi:MAG: DegT/DnrJ/EryC1/StrS family aminotransferase [Verrucomicrobiota bacterium]
MGIHQLRRADELHRKRTQWAGRYSALLADVAELILPTQQPDRIHSWHLYSIRLKLDRLQINRAEAIDALKLAGITTSVHWMPLHQHPYYREKYGYQPDDLPMAARLYPELITLPLYPDMSEADVTYACDTLKHIIAANLCVGRGVDSAAVKRTAACRPLCGVPPDQTRQGRVAWTSHNNNRCSPARCFRSPAYFAVGCSVFSQQSVLL